MKITLPRPPYFLIISTLSLWPLCSSSWAQNLSHCENLLLNGKTLSDYIKEAKELPEQQRDQKYLTALAKVKKLNKCSALLDMAELKENGLLIERSPIASDLLNTFNQFHFKWIMPEDNDRTKTCNDQYQWDVFDPKAPAYLMTRTLFQKKKEASQIVLSYGEPRIVRQGDDPTTSKRTQRTGEDYKEALGLEKEFSFIGDGEILGFLYERALNSTQFTIPKSNQARWADKMPFKNEHNIYQHFGAGLLGSPSFLYYHLKKKAFYESDGSKHLSRSLVDSIFQNLLCSSPDQYFNQEDLTAFTKEFSQSNTQSTSETLWNHPITKEENCLSCHFPMDKMASGFRNLTLIPSSEQCDQKQIQVLYPIFLKSNHVQEMWRQASKDKNEEQKDSQDFSASYGTGSFRGKRFRTLRQLGSLIAEDPNFYSCQVKRYYQWIHKSYPQEKTIERLGREYQKHQDGLKLLSEILDTPPTVVKDLQESM